MYARVALVVVTVAAASCESGGERDEVPSALGSCAHDPCVAGAKLSKSCDACVSQVCTSDSYCCATKWDQQSLDGRAVTANAQNLPTSETTVASGVNVGTRRMPVTTLGIDRHRRCTAGKNRPMAEPATAPTMTSVGKWSPE
jgi:hypothetical protein